MSSHFVPFSVRSMKQETCQRRSFNSDEQPICGLVSIIMPCYRGERHLADAIGSCLEQSYQDFELIIVDDASPDRCFEIAERFAERDARIRLVRRKQNGGVARAFNTGFEVARGEYLTRLAQDDLFEPGGIEALVRAFSAGPPNVGLVYSDTRIINEGGEFQGLNGSPRMGDALRFGNNLGLGVMWKREVWELVGGFDPECDAAEDYDYWLRVAACFPITRCEGPPTVRVRFHSEMGSVRHASRQVASTFRAVLKAYGPSWSRKKEWKRRQLAWGCARMTAVFVHMERHEYWEALRQLMLSFREWPLPFPHAAYEYRGIRLLLLCNLARKLPRIAREGRGPAVPSSA